MLFLILVEPLFPRFRLNPVSFKLTDKDLDAFKIQKKDKSTVINQLKALHESAVFDTCTEDTQGSTEKSLPKCKLLIINS